MQPPTESAVMAAQAIEQHSTEAAETLVGAFLRDYPASNSSSLGRERLEQWALAIIDDLTHILRGGQAQPNDLGVYAGDMLLNVDPLFNPVATVVETWVFVGRNLAPFLWRALADHPRDAQQALRALEAAILTAIRAVAEEFLAHQLVDGSLIREWEMTSRSPRTAGNDLPIGRGDALTPREEDIARLVAHGHSNAEIASTLHLSQSTVKNHLSRIFDKLQVRSRTELTHLLLSRSDNPGVVRRPT